MTWPVRSKRFGLYNGTPAANTFVSLGTVPAGKTWLLKDWHFYNGGGSSRTCTVCIKSGGVVYIVDHAGSVASAGITGNFSRHVVATAGEEVGFMSSLSAACHFGIHGAQLG